MGSDATSFVGTIPAHYDRDLGPLIFADYAADMARRVAAFGPTRVLETAAGAGIVTRRLRDLLPLGRISSLLMRPLHGRQVSDSMPETALERGDGAA